MILYLHGGPGFSSHAEIEILRETLKANSVHVDFWHEPSVSGDQAFSDQIDSIDKRLSDQATVIAHSFSVHLILALQNLRPRLGLKLIVIAPVIDLVAAHRRILRLAASDLLATDSTTSTEISDCADQMQTAFDSFGERGLTLAAQDTKLFNHYWQNAEVATQFTRALASANRPFNVQSFVQTLKEFSKFPAPRPVPGVERLGLIFGQVDPVVDIAAETQLAQHLFRCNPETTVFPSSGHWPHLEQPDAFTQFLKRFI